MRLTKKDLKLVLPFLLFVAIGISGLFSVDFLAVDYTMESTLKWCGIPILIFSGYYAYQSTFGYSKLIKTWRNALGFIVLTFICSMMTFVSCQGMLIKLNSSVGVQKDYLLEGQIVKLAYPEKKKLINSYAIMIARSTERDTTKLNVPTNQYSEGEVFSKTMKIGSLGFIYANE